MESWNGVIDRYRSRLPVSETTRTISLNEGNTPLIRATNLERQLDARYAIWLKYEGLNPTASFKDRGMTVAVTSAVQRGARAVICASTGNTSSSAAAYAARAGIDCVVLLPAGKIALGKLAQAMIYGATVIAIDGNFDQALDLVRQLGATGQFEIVNSINPDRIEGQKTAAFEVCDVLGHAPDCHVLPVGNAGNITAYWKGYTEYAAAGVTDRRPQMLGFQAEGAAPIVRGAVVEHPDTVATAIRIGNPASWKQAEAARDESGGLIDMVSDDEILAAYRLVAAREGVFVEPACGAAVAGLLKLDRQGYFQPDQTVVVTLTGHGLKDPDNAMHVAPQPIQSAATAEAVLKAIGKRQTQ